MWKLSIPNDRSADEDYFYTCFELPVSYDWRVTAMKLSPETVRMLGSRLLGLLSRNPGVARMVKPHPDY